jgi:hypothetical protein
VPITWTETVGPYGASGNAPGEQFENDVIIFEAYPGLILNGTESNNVWTEYREVAGDAFITTNATYDPTNGWTQVNPSLPSFAYVFRATGEIDRLTAPVSSPTPIVWTKVFELDANGDMITTTGVLSLSSQVAWSLNPTWTAGTNNMIGFAINLTNNSSGPLSELVNFKVNGTTIFSISPTGVVFFGGTSAQTNPGSTSLPGGVTMIWGFTAGIPADDSADGTLTFASPFPTATLNVSPTIDTGASAGADALTIRWFSPVVGGFKVHVSGGAPGATCTVSFTAIGY